MKFGRLFIPAFLLIFGITCKDSVGPEADYEVIGIRFRIFLNFNDSPEEPYYFWLKPSNNWTGDTITSSGGRLLIRCNNCPPKPLVHEDGALEADKANFTFLVDGPSQNLSANLEFGAGNYGRIFRDEDIRVMYVTVSWQCTKWNFEHEMFCTGWVP